MVNRQRCAGLMSVTLFLGIIVGTAGAQVLGNRLEAPDGAQMAKAQKAVNEILGEEIAKAKSVAAIKALAAKLFDFAKDTKEVPANRWVLYTLARKKAASVGDVTLAVAVLDEQATVFAIPSRLELAAETVEELATAASPTGVGNKPLLDFLSTQRPSRLLIQTTSK